MTATTLRPHHIPGYAGIPEYRPGVMICTGMTRPLWPERWRLFRHGFFVYRITAIGPDGEEMAVTLGPPGPVTAIYWYAKRKLRIDRSEYRRRQRARVKRKRR